MSAWKVPAVVALLVGGLAPAAGAAPTPPYLFTRPGFVTLGSPHQMALADLDGDGREDLIATVGFRSNLDTFGVSVQLARPGGGYAPAVRYKTGERVDGVQVVDLDGDGRKDVLVERYLSGAEDEPADRRDSVAVLLNLERGELADPVDLPITEITSFVAADLGGARPGIVASSDSGLTFYEQTSPLAFAPVDEVAASPMLSLVAADLDADGIDEILGADIDGAVDLYRGRARHARNAIGIPATLETADLDLDGMLEVLAVAGSQTLVLDAGLKEIKRVTTSTSGLDAAAGDFDHDGKADLVVTTDSPVASVFLGRGGPAKQILLADPASSVAVIDATGDGHPDILAMETMGSIVETVEGDGTGNFAPIRPSFPTDSAAWDVATGDVNGDEKLDIVTGQWDPYFGAQLAGYKARVLVGDGAGTFRSTVTLDLTGASPSDTEVADVNGDGFSDVVSLDYYGGLSLFLSYGDGTFRPRIVIHACHFNAGLAVADFNEDGYEDVAVACRSAIFRDQVRLWLGAPAGLVEGPQLAFSGNYNTWSMRIGDINGDGNLDIALGSLNHLNAGDPSCQPQCLFAPNSNTVAYFLSLAPGVFDPVARYHFAGQWFVDFRLGDVNKDGRSDLVYALARDSAFVVLEGKADGTLAKPRRVETYDAPEYFAIGDVTGDGAADIVSGHAAKILSVTPGAGGGLFDEPLSYAARMWVGEPLIFDANGDGKNDVIAGYYSGLEAYFNGG